MSVHRGVCLSVCWDTTPPRSRHSGAGTPRTRHPRDQAPPPPADGYCCGRYASYWNAFLLQWTIGDLREIWTCSIKLFICCRIAGVTLLRSDLFSCNNCIFASNLKCYTRIRANQRRTFCCGSFERPDIHNQIDVFYNCWHLQKLDTPPRRLIKLRGADMRSFHSWKYLSFVFIIETFSFSAQPVSIDYQLIFLDPDK